MKWPSPFAIVAALVFCLLPPPPGLLFRTVVRPQILSWEGERGGRREKRKVDSHFTAGEEGREVYCVF